MAMGKQKEGEMIWIEMKVKCDVAGLFTIANDRS